MHTQTVSRFGAASTFKMAVIPLMVAASLLAGCGNKDEAKGATQAAARVNGQEVTVHQINLILERQPSLKPDQIDLASRQVLEGLVDQELAVQMAEEMKLDRDPKVLQILDAQRRATLSRMYLDKVSTAGVGTPSADDVRKYFDENPGLFSNRRVYVLQEFLIQGEGEPVAQLRAKLEQATTAPAFVELIKASGLKAQANQVTQPAESLPMGLVKKLNEMKDGQALLETIPGGLKIVIVAASRPQPLTFDQAKPAIERFLVETRRAEWLKNHIKDLRGKAKVDYVGKFAEKSADAASGASQPAVAAPALDAAASAASAPGGIDPAALNKGLSGLK